MSFYNIKKGLCFLLVAGSFLACDNKDNDSVFEKNPTERIAERKKELADALKSSEFGWKVVYYTDNSSFGGFTFLFNFIDDVNVVTASDFSDEDITPETGEYGIDLRATVSLVFTTKNKIHVLADSYNSPLSSGQGYKGDVQFGYYGRDNEDIVFQTVKSRKEFRMVKATAEDWANLGKNRIMGQNMSKSDKPLFRSLEITTGGTMNGYELNYSGTTRFAQVESAVLAPINEENGFGVSFTNTGIKINPAVVVGDVVIDTFDYNAANEEFVSVNSGDVRAVIKYLTRPFQQTDDYKVFLKSSAVGFIGEYLSGAAGNSDLFKKLLNDLFAAQPANYIDRIEIGFRGPTANSTITYSFLGGMASVTHTVRVTEGPLGNLKFTHVSWSSNTMPDQIREIDGYLMDPNGVFAKKEKYKVGAPNVIYTFSAAGTPFKMTTYIFN
ncbi:DUF4302 domain-containing protein [Flavobacterium sp. JP2137]|uniref:DUF4302 domain-containing protein n=1 Tax=Flavobacterium sp. JP2137 TaxID=3414510 RepID=UPI003D3009E2